MPTQPMLTAVERYLAAQFECAKPTGTAAEKKAREVQLQKARHEMESEARKPVPAAGIRKILVAIDHAHHPALETALKLAKPLHAQVAIVCAVEPLIPPSVMASFDPVAVLEQIRGAAKSILAACEREVPANALAFTILREGPAAAEIVATASDFGADLIVMGTHRRGPLARFFLGSTSQAVLRHAHCPVMFVSDNPATPAPAV